MKNKSFESTIVEQVLLKIPMYYYQLFVFGFAGLLWITDSHYKITGTVIMALLYFCALLAHSIKEVQINTQEGKK